MGHHGELGPLNGVRAMRLKPVTPAEPCSALLLSSGLLPLGLCAGSVITLNDGTATVRGQCAVFC